MLSILNNVLLISMPGGSEWILIIVVVLLMFGGKKIPELMRGIGRGMREFTDAKNNVKSEIEEGNQDFLSCISAEVPPFYGNTSAGFL